VAATASDLVTVDVDGAELRIARVIGTEVDGARRLIAEWTDGRAAVAALA
jgi:hypothetical protein